MVTLRSLLTFGFLSFEQMFWPGFTATTIALALKLTSVTFFAFASEDDSKAMVLTHVGICFLMSAATQFMLNLF